MAEWSKAAVLKTVSGETRSGVRIPVPPPGQPAGCRGGGTGFQALRDLLRRSLRARIPVPCGIPGNSGHSAALGKSGSGLKSLSLAESRREDSGTSRPPAEVASGSNPRPLRNRGERIQALRDLLRRSLRARIPGRNSGTPRPSAKTAPGSNPRPVQSRPAGRLWRRDGDFRHSAASCREPLRAQIPVPLRITILEGWPAVGDGGLA